MRVARVSTVTGTLLSLVVPSLCAVAGWLLWGGLIDGAMLGAGSCVAVRYALLRFGFARHHGKASRAARAEDWQTALQAFEQSQAAWESRPTVDRFRALLLGATIKWPYAVMARYNQVVCLGQLDRLDEARQRLAALRRDVPGLPQAQELEGWLHGRRSAGGGEGGWFEE